jgi:hypothetical protein
MGTSSTDQDKAQERIITWRVALLTTVAGLVIAVISAGSAIVGVVIASNNAREQARDEFLRTQRQELYVRFFTSYEDLFSDVVRASSDPDGFTPTEADELANRVDALRVELNFLQLVASARTGNIAASMYDDARSHLDGVVWDYCQQVPPPPAEICGDLGARPEPVAYEELISNGRQFLEAVRADLGAD